MEQRIVAAMTVAGHGVIVRLPRRGDATGERSTAARTVECCTLGKFRGADSVGQPIR